MKKKILIAVPAILIAALPLVASAHERATYDISGQNYQVVIGSLNEPLVVDDKTGVDLTVTKCTTAACAPSMGPDGDMDGPAGTGVTGLDQTLKVTLIAAGKKRTLALSPQYGKVGAYTAAFYPTVATTLAYEITGTINSTPIDITYTCIPEGSPMAANDTTHKQISTNVTQTSVTGGFGCPIQKEDLGFPESSATILSLASGQTHALDTAYAALGLSVLALAAVLVIRKRS